MDARRENVPSPMKNRTTVERKSEREIVVTRTFNGPARIVFEAWTKPELLKRWWVPKSIGFSLLSCEADVRVGGRYRFEFGNEGSKPMAFFGRYLEVTPHSRLVWTNEETDGGSITTVTFEEKDGRRCWSCTNSIPQRKRSMPTPGWRVGCPRHLRNWTSFLSPWARAQIAGYSVVIWRIFSGPVTTILDLAPPRPGVKERPAQERVSVCSVSYSSKNTKPRESFLARYMAVSAFLINCSPVAPFLG